MMRSDRNGGPQLVPALFLYRVLLCNDILRAGMVLNVIQAGHNFGPGQHCRPRKL